MFLLKNIIYILILITCLACNVTEQHNPFDDNFNIKIERFAKNSDTLSAGCGYFNYENNYEAPNLYYQIHIDAPSKIVAKGFSYSIDTFEVSRLSPLDSIIALPFDSIKLNASLSRYEYQVLRRKDRQIIIHHIQKRDTISLPIKLFFNDKTTPQTSIRKTIYYKGVSSD